MKLWQVVLLATVNAYDPFGFAPRPTEETSPAGPSDNTKLVAISGEERQEDTTSQMPGFKNFGIANERGGGLLPLGLECKMPTERGQNVNKQRILGESRIVNGTEAGINWPFIVRLKVDGLYQCGGSILNEEWILTAAHCLNRMKFVMITLGDLHRTDIEEGEINLLSTDFFIHPDFDQIKMTNDIALIRLPKSIQFNDRMQPVCLAQRPPIVGKNCFVAGWGTISAGGMVASRLLEASVPVIHDSKCNLAESYGDWFKKDSMICAGKFDAGGTDSCQGDSGGPLICVVGNTPVLTGVVSWGVGCAQKKKPGVYARVHKLKSWIEKSVLLGSAADPTQLDSSEPIKAQTTTLAPMLTTQKTSLPPPPPTMAAGPLLPGNLKCTENSIDSRYGSRLYRSRLQSGLFDRIIMGQDVASNSWKWITHFQNCGASLIAQRWAITAAHCCSPRMNGKPLTFGSIHFNGTGEFTQTVHVVDFQIHQEYVDDGKFKNDICLLQLSQNVKSTPDVAPICLPKNRVSDNFIGTCYIGGWGVLQESGDEMADRLQEAEVPFVNHGRCQKIYEKAGTVHDDLMMCFGGGESDSCQGDSGGPLVCVENGNPVLRGIVSFGKGCGRPGLPGIYTRVSNYIDWIDESIEMMLARTSCGPLRSAYRFAGNDVLVSCGGVSCHLKCKDEILKPTIEKVTCVNPFKKRWSPNNKKSPVIQCVDKKTMTLCGPVKEMYKFDDKAQVMCNGGKSCTVTCPSGMKPNHATLQCINPKRKKMNPLVKSFIKCTDPKAVTSSAGSSSSAAHDAVEQPLTDPRKPRGACRNIRRHPQYRAFLKAAPALIVNCQMSCSSGKVPCGRPDVSVCKFFCPSGQEATPHFDAVCQKKKRSRHWTLTPPTTILPQC